MGKRCSKCGETKDAGEFYLLKSGRAAGSLFHICKACCSKVAKEYRATHRDKLVSQCREWHQKNRDRDQERWQGYYQRNHASMLERAKAYSAAHRNECRESKRRWVQTHRLESKFRSMSATTGISVESLLGRFEYYGWKCRYCGKQLEGRDCTSDHRIPPTRGGPQVAANIVPSCQSCNSRKKRMTEREYLSKFTALMAMPTGTGMGGK